jgi:hypothetical protein
MDRDVCNDVKAKFIQLSKLFLPDNLKKLDRNFPKEEQLALLKLSKMDKLVFLKPDKGNGLVVIDKTDYFQKAYELINDTTKFKKLKNENTLKIENKLNRILINLKKHGHISEDTYKHLRSSGSTPGLFYGLPKIHKPSVPLRPIISGVGTPCHKMASYLAKYLSPLAISNSTLKDTFDFTNSLLNMDSNQCRFMVSFDVTSLFTCVPLNEVIDLILQYIYDEHKLPVRFPKEDLSKLLYICTSENCFCFDNGIYTQIDGVAMGSPLGPVLANIFMNFIESKLFDNNNINGLIYWKRYVDDIFAIFDHHVDVSLVTNIINNIHPSIKFTSESENNGRLHFLDVNIVRTKDGLRLSTYLKPTHTGLYTLWSSFIPTKYKLNLISCLLNRSYSICSTWEAFTTEINIIKNKLLSLEYPSYYIDVAVKNFLRTKHIVDFNDKSKMFGPNKKKVYIELPYIGRLSNKLTRELKDLMKSFNCYDLRVVLKGVKTTRKLLGKNHKCKLFRSFISGAVYKINCCSCGAFYVGETKRQVSVRMAEHRLALRGFGHSSAAEHTFNTKHNMDYDNVCILSRDLNERRLKIKEALFIKDLKPSLNNQLQSFCLSVF